MDLKKTFSDVLETFLAGKLNAFEVPAKDAPHLTAKVAELAERAGVGKIPALWLSQDKKPNAAAVPMNRLMVTTGLMRGFETGYKDPLSSEFEAVLGHEMSHLKNQKMEVGVSMALMALPFAGMIAYHFIRKGREHGKDDQDTLKAVNEAVDERIAKGQADLDAAPETEKAERGRGQKLLQGLGTGIKYCAVAGVGVVAGQFALRQFKLNREFAADKFGAELTSPEAMISALEKLHAYGAEVMAKMAEKDSPENKGAATKILTAATELLKHTTAAHPSLQDRTDALRGR